MIDLLILEDEEDERVVYERMAKRYGLSSIAFASGLEVLKYLNSLPQNELPGAYLVDMRTSKDGNELELASPLEIFNFLKNLNSTENFRFHTGHFSQHDREIQGLTNAQVIIKAEDDIYLFLEQLKSSKTS